MTVQKAESTLKDKGFEVSLQVEQVSDEKITAGLIVRTSPAIGRKVKKGTTITLYESLGNTVYEMEDFTGKNYIEIKTILTTKYNLNVTVEKVDVENKEELDKQAIIKQEPSVGTKMSKGEKVTLYIPNIVDTYPNFVEEAWTLEEIQNFCDEYGINVTFVPKETEEFTENTIIKQDRQPGDPIIKGANLKITYATKYSTVDDNKDNTENKDKKTNNKDKQ